MPLQVSGSSVGSLTMPTSCHSHRYSATYTQAQKHGAIKYASEKRERTEPRARRLINIQNSMATDMLDGGYMVCVPGLRMKYAVDEEAVGCSWQDEGTKGCTSAHLTQSHKRSSFAYLICVCVCVCGSNLCGIENFGRFDILTLVDKIYANLYMHGGS